ncbi:MAG: hypothetical protein JSS76_05040 [Bacteroidetes bacterium]|nr:hypothetical protein [Bacteroidota bacterium]
MTRYILSGLFAIACTSAIAQALPVKKISIFKNGTAMIVHEGSTPVTGGKATLPVPSRAIYGTYFLGTGKDNSVKNIAIKNDTIKKEEKAITIWQLIAGNVGKKVTLSVAPAGKIDRAVSGKILSYNQQSGLIRLQSDNNKIEVFKSGDVYLAEFAEEEKQTYLADSIQRSLVITPATASGSLNVQEIYLQTGMNWMPSYFMILKDEKSARLEMKATIENFADALSDAETELVVGAPQMTNSDRLDPMTYDYQTMDRMIEANRMGLYANNVQAKTMSFGYSAPAADAFAQDFSTAGEKNDDLYIYKIGKVSLGKNAKGIYPIFAGSIEYKDKYEGLIEDRSNFAETRATSNDETPIDVFHSLEIKNTASVPLTTAPVTIINEKDQFVAQNEITYTPAGSTSTVRLSKAIDIIMKNPEEETSRTDNAKKIGKQVYSSVKIKGTISLENYQNKEVTVAVTKNTNGEVSAASDGGKITRQKSYANINPATQIKWDVKLAANQKKTVSYEYEVFFLPQ